MEGWQRPLMKAARTMQQLRNLEPLGKGNPPHREYIAIPGCGRVDLAEVCPGENFAKLVDTLLR